MCVCALTPAGGARNAVCGVELGVEQEYVITTERRMSHPAIIRMARRDVLV